jgi:uncharacterized repeat protein (TIGR01451 family)
LPSVTWITAWVSDVTNVVVRWRRTSGGDFARYSVYLSSVEGTTNLSRADVVTETAAIGATNWTNYGVPDGIWYGHVTALDTWPLTNESWYSPQASVWVLRAPVVVLAKSVDFTTRRPFEILRYTIAYSNAGPTAAAGGFELIDAFPFESRIVTNSAENQTGLHAGTAAVSYATNLATGVWQNDAYDTPATVPGIRRVRWVLSAPIAPDEKGTITFEVQVR